MRYKFPNICKIKNNFKKGITPLLCALTIFNICAVNVSASSSFVVPLGDPVYIDPYMPSLTDVNISVNQYGSISSALKLEGSSSFTYRNFVTEPILGIDMPNPGVSGYYDVVISFATPYIIPKGVYDIRIYCYSSSNMGAFRSINLSCYDSYWNSVLPSNSIPGYVSSKTENDDFFVTFNNVVISGDFVNIGLTGSIYYQWDGNYANFMVVPGTFEFSEVNQTDVILQSRPSGSISNVSSSGITSVEDKENALVGSNASTSELSVNINPLASSVVWNLIDNVVTGNAKVFTMFISILTIAVIGLILNR